MPVASLIRIEARVRAPRGAKALPVWRRRRDAGARLRRPRAQAGAAAAAVAALPGMDCWGAEALAFGTLVV